MENSDLAAQAVRPSVAAAAPVLSSVVPNTGPSAGSSTVTLNGSSFTGATAVNFGTNLALSYTVDTAAKITAVTPPGTGAVPVTVRSPGGTSNAVTYTYAATPTLTTVSPNQGAASGGTTVTLTGTGMTGATAVTFGSNAATTYTVNSATQITAVAPAGTGAVPVTVTAPGGTSNTVIYTYVAAPVLSALSPAQGPTDAGAGITLTGSALTTTGTVSFGATPAAFTVLSDTTVVALAPAGPGGPVSVNVTTAGGISNSRTYTRVSPPAI
ncbi:IPT/TIG domain-containing protein [Streptomyces sp. NPDC090798]|uniref:IPT/TIG domain-containing protein n=1 Tax=Streptomyces sp. NPDC090798 TaxID=3365968 RepID=UPI00382233BE